MTKVYFSHCGDTFLLTCEGHANYAEKGKDIVCAGISALCCALEAALENLSEINKLKSYLCTATDGSFKAEAAAADGTEVQTVFETIYNGLCRIESGYCPYICCQKN